MNERKICQTQGISLVLNINSAQILQFNRYLTPVYMYVIIYL